MRLVLDSSATLAWVHDDERTAAVESLFDGVVRDGAIVPALWHLEVANSLTVAVRRKRIDAQYRDGVLDDLSQLDIVVDGETDRRAWSATLQLAETYALSVYDAAYLELALRVGRPLATLDIALARAAQMAGVEVLP